MRWDNHCDLLVRRLSSVVYQLRALRGSLSLSALIGVYGAEFESRMTYGLIFWGHSPAARRIFLLQKRAIRCVAGVRRTVSCRPFYRKYGVLTLTSLYILLTACYVHSRRGSLTAHSDMHSYSTRNCCGLLLPKHRLNLSQTSPLYAGIKVYNKLPASFRNLSQNTFKRELRCLLGNIPFYSMGEFFGHCFV